MRSAKAVALTRPALPSGHAVGPRVIPALEALCDHMERFLQFQGNRRACELARGLIAIDWRAAAFAAELKHLKCDELLRSWISELASGLNALAAVARPQKGCPPLVGCWAVGKRSESLQGFEELAKSLAAVLSKVVAARKSEKCQPLINWPERQH